LIRFFELPIDEFGCCLFPGEISYHFVCELHNRADAAIKTGSPLKSDLDLDLGQVQPTAVFRRPACFPKSKESVPKEILAKQPTKLPSHGWDLP
jgi:hypothetical protein